MIGLRALFPVAACVACFAMGYAASNLSAKLDMAEVQLEYAGKLQEKDALIGQLKASLAEQNLAVAAMAAQAQGAELARQQAELRAEEQAQLSQRRLQRLQEAAHGATTAGDVLLHYWEDAR